MHRYLIGKTQWQNLEKDVKDLFFIFEPSRTSGLTKAYKISQKFSDVD